MKNLSGNCWILQFLVIIVQFPLKISVTFRFETQTAVGVEQNSINLASDN